MDRDHAIPTPDEVSPQRRAELRAALVAVRTRIDAACEAAQRDPAQITLVVVTKFFPAADAIALARLGVTDIGESRDQEAGAKLAAIRQVLADQSPRLHFIGQLQSNKAARVGEYADAVHSIDRAKLVSALARGAQQAGHTLDALVQVDLGGNDTGRGGARPADVEALADLIAGQEGLRLAGLMAVAPLGVPPAPAFADLAALSERVRANHPEARWISAGMSGDLEAAIAAGSTCLRVGSAILGSRPTRG